MKTYAVMIYNLNEELLSAIVWKRPRFTKKEYDMVIAELFFWASEGKDYDHLCADILERDTDTPDETPLISLSKKDFKGLFYITCHTRQLPLTTGIKSYFFIKGQCVRTMKLAD